MGVQSIIQKVFQEHFHGYAQGRKLPLHVWKAASAMKACRTAALGGHVQRCPEGHVERVWYNSCKHRSCPLCAFIQITRWVEKQFNRLINCDYFHVVFTVPSELNDLWEHNRALFTNLLFKASWQCLKELLADPKHLGALPGAIASFHSWCQTLWIHPHAHFLVTGGGITPEKQWLNAKESFLLPSRVLRPKFRGKFLAFLRKALDAGELRLPEGVSRQQCLNLFQRLGREKWHVRIMPPYKHGRGVVQYLGRYVRGGPVSDRRLTRSGPGNLLLRYKNETRTGVQFMTLTVHEFISRFIRHIPLTGVHHVRAFGLFAPSARELLNHARSLRGQLPVHDADPPSWQTVCAKAGDQHPEICPVCGKPLISAPLSPTGLSPPCRKIA